MPGADAGATDGVDSPDEDGDRDGPSPWSLWIAVGSLTSAAFAAGLLVGVVADGNAEIMREFRERSPARAASPTIPDPRPRPPVATPSATADGMPVGRRRNNQVDWAITIAAGTNVAPLDVRTADLDADSKVEFGMVYGGQVSAVATLWVQAASSARIVLPIGRYSVRTTRIRMGPQDDAAESEAVVVDGIVEVERDSTDRIPASLAGDRTGTWRIAPASPRIAGASVRTRAKRRARTRDSDYEGLGDGSRTGGTSTYGG